MAVFDATPVTPAMHGSVVALVTMSVRELPHMTRRSLTSEQGPYLLSWIYSRNFWLPYSSQQTALVQGYANKPADI